MLRQVFVKALKPCYLLCFSHISEKIGFQVWVRPLDGLGGDFGESFWRLFGDFGRPFGAMGGSLGGFGGPLGGFGELLGGFGTLLGCIGQLWGDFGWVWEAFRSE